jgi:hypothetical protein
MIRTPILVAVVSVTISCNNAIASAVNLACDGHIIRHYPSEKPPESEALSVVIDESAGTVTISHYGKEAIEAPAASGGLVRFGDTSMGVLKGSVDRLTGVIEFRLTTSSLEPLLNYEGQCKPARPLF